MSGVTNLCIGLSATIDHIQGADSWADGTMGGMSAPPGKYD